jgi:hypothetical protein
MNLYELNDEGFQWEQILESEIDSANTALNTWSASLLTWFGEAVNDSEAGTNPEVPPAPPTWVSAPGSTNLTNAWIRVGIRILLYWLRQKLKPGTTSNEIAQTLRRAFLQEGATGDDVPIVEKLANTPLEIIISNLQDYEDFLYSDRPES